MSEISKLEQSLIIKKIDKETVNIKILDNNILIPLVGEFNKNLLDLEKILILVFFLEEILLQ
tara:strand:+ start:1329 stop:1514 length:186 start_codon:yes stop_codon:yes gene_type:complete